jgi:hypothetical protein
VYRFIFWDQATAGNAPLEADLITLNVGGAQCFIHPIYHCQVLYTPPVGFQYICLWDLTDENLVVTNLLEEPTPPFQVRYDLDKLPSEEPLFQAHLEQYIIAQGHTIVESGNPVIYQRKSCETECINFSSMEFCNLQIVDGCEIEWCDFLYELCDLHACIVKKVKDMMCMDCDPCKECDNEAESKAKKAKEHLYHLSALFFFSLVPLIAKDRLEYLGDLTIDDSRLSNVMKIKDIFTKLVDFTDRCGECITMEEDTDCGC